MPRKLKVYGISLGISRMVVAATSLSAAAKAMDITYHTMNTYGCETFNEKEIALCMAEPGQVFVQSLRNQWEGFVKIETLDGRY